MHDMCGKAYGYQKRHHLASSANSHGDSNVRLAQHSAPFRLPNHQAISSKRPPTAFANFKPVQSYADF
ncbi:hypothetical protein ACTXT7_002311 [Hymenolepis weldensis]